MSNIAPIADIRVKSKVIENSWNYVFDNFHKFTDSNKIKVVLAIITKDMPTHLEHSGKIEYSTEEINARVSRLNSFLKTSEN